MADQKLTEIYTAGTTLVDPGDLAYGVKNTGTTPDENAFKYSQLMSNRYKITPSVSSNDLVLAIKHEDGSDPSADRPLYFKIGNSLRACTAALSVTKADGTSWANLGVAHMGGLEHDLFVYVIWNTNKSPDAVDIFWSRIPYGRTYADFSGTSTAENYAAIGATAAAASDECVCIGRFAATLSLAATSYLWTVPTYTNANLIHHPIDRTRTLNFTHNWTNITIGSGTTYATYQLINNRLVGKIGLILNSTTVGSAPYIRLPFSILENSATTYENVGQTLIRDTGTALFEGGCYMITAIALYPQCSRVSGSNITSSDITATVPMTWADTDELSMTFDFAIA